jgi:hypothetical protein
MADTSATCCALPASGLPPVTGGCATCGSPSCSSAEPCTTTCCSGFLPLSTSRCRTSKDGGPMDQPESSEPESPLAILRSTPLSWTRRLELASLLEPDSTEAEDSRFSVVRWLSGSTCPHGPERSATWLRAQCASKASDWLSGIAGFACRRPGGCPAAHRAQRMRNASSRTSMRSEALLAPSPGYQPHHEHARPGPGSAAAQGASEDAAEARPDGSGAGVQDGPCMGVHGAPAAEPPGGKIARACVRGRSSGEL